MDKSRLEGLRDAIIRVKKRAKQAGMDAKFIGEVDHIMSTVSAHIEAVGEK